MKYSYRDMFIIGDSLWQVHHIIMVDRMVQKLALGATGAKRLHRRAAAVTGVYTEIVEREALLQAWMVWNNSNVEREALPQARRPNV